ncbi:MAG: hypothetical protein KDD69_07760 [Bdellovibrionales bacterium]|nr:hypothetical protein [Bdellovibrionales bacterium]
MYIKAFGKRSEREGGTCCERAGRNECGQAMTEYIILLFAVVLVCATFAKLLPEAIQGYVRPIYYSVAKPFP